MICKRAIQHVGQSRQTKVERGGGLLVAAGDGVVHVLERDVLEAEDPARVVMRDEDAVHAADADLHAVRRQQGPALQRRTRS